MDTLELSQNSISALGFLVVAVLFFYLRSQTSNVPIYEGFVVVFLILGIYLAEAAFVSRVKFLECLVAFLGRHSMNIFLIHSFFNMHCKEFLQTFSPLVGFFMVLCASLACSIAVEGLKYLLGIKWAMRKLKRIMA